MKPSYIKTVKVNASISQVYRLCHDFFEQSGYKLYKSIENSQLKFIYKKPFTISDYYLDIDFRMDSDNNVIIDFRYYYFLGLGTVTGAFIASKSKEINSLLSKIDEKPSKSTERICIECKKEIPVDAKFCPYCSHKYQE